MKRLSVWILVGISLLFFAGLLKATLPQTLIGSWTAAGSLSQARSSASAVLLANGSILITGGEGGSGPLQSAELVGTDGAVSSTGAMNHARSKHFAVVLSDGRALVGGGLTSGGGTTNTAEIYDPSANSWTQINPLTQARSNATAALLQDGRVLIAGGDNQGNPSNSLEIYDPSSGNFTFAGTLSTARTQHAMTVLQDGRVLIVGGTDGTNPLASSDIFDPSSGMVSPGPNLATARYAASATTLLNGQVAVIGGAGTGGSGTVDLASVEVFDPSTGLFLTASTSLTTAREGHQAFLLPNNNNVLITGGTSGGTTLASADLFTATTSPTDGSWSYSVSATGTMTTARAAASGSANQKNGPASKASPIPGLVIVGGGTDASGTTLSSSEAYGYPTVQTDQGDYPPGTTVNITGSGFQPNESVTITLVESPLIDSHGPYTVTADGSGNISDSSFTTDEHDASIKFYMSAIGNQSGRLAENVFTDANVKVFSAPAGVTFLVGFKTFNNSGNCTGTVTNTGTQQISPNQQSNNGNLGVGNPASVELQAPALSDQGGAFQNWGWTGLSNEIVAAVGSTIPLSSTTTTDPICIEATSGSVGSGTFTATYATAASAPTINAASPSSGDLSTTENVVLTGTNYVSQSSVSFGPNITVNSTTVNSDTQISVNITVGSGAALGARSVSVTNPGSGGGSATGTLTNGFTINKRTTSTSVSCTPNPDNLTTGTSCTAIVTDNDSGTVVGSAGTVSFGGGSGTFTPSSATCTLGVPSGGTASCSVSYKPSAAGSESITANYGGDSTHLTSSGSSNLTNLTAPTISKGFSPAVILLNGTSTVTFKITNSNTVALTGVAFTDNFPAGMVVASTPNVNNNCGGTVTANAGNTSIALSAGNIAGSSSCTVGVNLTASASGTLNNTTGPVSSTNGGTGSTSNTATLTVNNPATTLAVAPAAGVYGGTVTLSATLTLSNGGTPVSGKTITFTLNGANAGSAVTNASGIAALNNASLTGINAGTYASGVGASFAGDANDLSSSGSASLTITKATATISVTPYTVSYDGLPHTATGTATGVGGANLNADLDVSGTTHTSAGDYPTDGWNFHDPAGNYADANGAVHDTIGQAKATISVTPYNVTYDGNPHTGTGTALGIGGINLIADLNLAGTTHTSAGDYTSDTWSFHDPSGNYSDAGGMIEDVIRQQQVMITIGDPKPTYDGQQHQAAITLVPGVAVLVTYDGVPFTGSNAPVKAGVHPVSVTVTDVNYTGSAAGTLTIMQATLTVTASDKTRAYGAANPTFDGVITGVVNNDPITATYSTTADQSSPVGTYPITPTLSDGGSGTLANYSVISNNGNLIITADALYVISPDRSRVFGAADFPLTPTLQGLVNGDTTSSVGSPVCNTVATSASMPGTYGITCTGVTSSNYTPVYVNGTLTVSNPLTAITSVQDKGGQTSETLEIDQTDTLTAYGQFADGHTRTLASAGGMSFTRADLTTPISGAAVAEAGGVLYAIGGTDGSNHVLNTIQAYNPKANTWSTIGATLATARGNAVAASVAERIYIIGGTDASNNPLSSIEVLDATSGTPTISAFNRTLSVARSDAAAVVWNQKLYVIGGSNGTAQSTVDIFDLVLGATSANDTGTALDASAAVLNNILYAFGNSGGSIQLVSFNGTTWSGPSATPLDATQGVGVTVYNNLLYIVNGSSVWSYDGTSFNQESNSLGNSHNSAQLVAIGSRIYVASGGAGSPNAKLDAFAPPEVTWASADSTRATIDNSGNLAAVARTDNLSPNYVSLTATSIANNSISASFNLIVDLKSQSINFGALADKTYGDADFSVSATATSGLAVTFSANGNCTVLGGTVHITGAGTCTIAGSQPGDNIIWAPAPQVMQSFNIHKATATITVTGYTVTYDGNTHMATGTATGAFNEPLTGLDLRSTSHIDAGIYSDTWTFIDVTGNYNNATGSVKDCIKKANALINVTPYSLTYDGSAHTATGTATGVESPTPANLSSLLHLDGTTHTSAGDYAGDSWTFDGNNDYNAASGTVHDHIDKANAIVSVTPYSLTYDGNVHIATGTATGVKGEMLSGLNLSGTTHTNAGSYTDTWTFTDITGNYNNATGGVSDSIAKANAATTVLPYSVTYDGNAHTATGAATGVKGEALAGLDLSGTTHIAAGNYNDTWTFTDVTGNYNNANGAVTDVITKANATITVTPYSVTYDGNGHTATGSVTGVKGEALTGLNISSTIHTNAGTYTDSWIFTDITGNYNNASGSVTDNIAQAPSATIVTCPASVTYSGAAQMPCSATVTGAVLSLQFTPAYANNQNAGVATASFTYVGDTNHTGSMGSANFTINPAGTATSVAALPTQSNWMQVVTITAMLVNQGPPASGTGTPPVGSVNFYYGPSTAACNSLGSAVLISNGALTPTADPNGNAASATVATPNLPVGSNTILACYADTADLTPNFVASYGSTTQVVIAAPIVTIVPTSISFGTQAAGTKSGVKSLTICNGPSGTVGAPCYGVTQATAALSINSIAFGGNNPGDFVFATMPGNNCGGSIAVGGSCTVNIQFAPQGGSSGVESAFLNVTDNNGNISGSMQSASVSGAGLSTIGPVAGSLSTDAIFATNNGCSAITISGNGTVDSYNGATNSGNVGTNGNVSLSGNPIINGTVYSPFGTMGSCSNKGTTGLSTSGKAQVTGGLKQVAGTVSYPLPPVAGAPTTNWSITSCPSGLNGCTSIGTKAVNLAPGQYGNLTVSGGTTVHVSTGTYSMNSLALTGNSVLYFDSGPVVINLAGATISSNSAVLDASGGSIVNPTGIASNAQVYYAGSNAIKLSGGSGSYALVYAPNSAVSVSGGSHFYGSIVSNTLNSSGNTAIHGDLSLVSIAAGNTLWFSSVGLKVQGLPNTGSVKLYVTNAAITFTSVDSNNVTHAYNVPVPNAVVTFSSNVTTASTTWDSANNRWSTLVPMSSVNGNSAIHTFLDGVGFPVLVDFPNGIQNVQWQAAYSTTYSGLSFNWQWEAAVYSTLGSNNALSVNSLDGADPAGTPESYKTDLVFGDLGPGYVGMYEGSTSVVPTIAPASVAPSDWNFGAVSQSQTGSVTMAFTLSNNQSGTLTMGSGTSFTPPVIALTGTNAADFSVAGTNCPAAGATLIGGGTCTISITFTPSTTGVLEKAKLSVYDNANNSPQSVFLEGTGAQ